MTSTAYTTFGLCGFVGAGSAGGSEGVVPPPEEPEPVDPPEPLLEGELGVELEVEGAAPEVEPAPDGAAAEEPVVFAADAIGAKGLWAPL